MPPSCLQVQAASLVIALGSATPASSEPSEIFHVGDCPICGTADTGYLYITDDGSRVEGVLRPLKVARVPDIKVEGWHRPDRLELSFFTVKGPLKATFFWDPPRDRYGGVWRSLEAGPILEPLKQPPSETELTLEEMECGGPIPESLAVEFDRAALIGAASFPVELDNLPVELRPFEPYAKLKGPNRGFPEDLARLLRPLRKTYVSLRQAWPIVRRWYLRKRHLEPEDKRSTLEVVYSTTTPDELEALRHSPLVAPETGSLDPVLYIDLRQNYLLIEFRTARLEAAADVPQELADLHMPDPIEAVRLRDSGVTVKEVWPFLREVLIQGGQYDEDDSLDVRVPFGTEAYVAQQMSKSPVVRNVRYTPTGCAGGVDLQIVEIPKSFVLKDGLIDDVQLQDLVETGLRKGLTLSSTGSGSETWRLGKARIRHHPLPPHLPLLDIEVYADSLITRRRAGAWDRFDLVVRPGDSSFNDGSEIAMEILIENLYSVTKGGRATIPSDTWFQSRIPEDEDVVTLSMMRLLSQALGGRCAFQRTMPDRESDCQ
jgi:hypothetical protein